MLRAGKYPKNLDSVNDTFLKPAMADLISLAENPVLKKWWASIAVDTILKKIEDMETGVQRAVDQISAVYNNQDLKETVALGRIQEAASTAKEKKNQQVEELFNQISAAGARGVREAMPVLPSTADKPAQLAELGSLKMDIRMRLDVVEDDHFAAEYQRLMKFYHDRGNVLAVWLLCNSDFMELYVQSRKIPFGLTVADRWQVYKEYASSDQQWAAAVAGFMGDFSLEIGVARPDSLLQQVINETTFPGVVTEISRGYDWALNV